MTGAELKAIRNRLGLSTTALGRAFGYEGTDVTASGTIRKYESGQRPIPPWLGRLATMFDMHGVPDEFLDTRRIDLESLRTEIAAATSVVDLCSLLNRFEGLRRDMARDGIDADDAELPNLEARDDVEAIDWSDWTNVSTPMAADGQHVLFKKNDGGGWMFMDIDDCPPEGDDE